MKTFDLAGPLPRGITVLEASAGTGKTYSIAQLLVRFVAEEGVPVEQVLIVTFTRLATEELKDRLRRRLSEAAACLRGEEAGDPLLQAWAAQAPDDQRDLWRQRLEVARDNFDTATISTIHRFCLRMLQLNAFESGTSFDLTLVHDLRSLRDQAVADWLTQQRYGTGDPSWDEYLLRVLDDIGLTGGDLEALAQAATSDRAVSLPKPQPVDLRTWEAEVQRVRDLARAHDPVQAIEEARGVLDARRYFAGSASKRWDTVREWLESRPSPLPMAGASQRDPLRTAHDYFLKHELKAAIHDGKRNSAAARRLLQHEFIVAWSQLHKRALKVTFTLRAHAARAFRTAVTSTLERRFEQGFDDLLASLDSALQDPSRGPALREAIRERFSVALIDEFQDTDPLQWRIFRTLFEEQPRDEEARRLVLIGDPKQAIYSFRGANVAVYLAARGVADSSFTMARNFRSDRPLIDGLNHLMNREGLFGVGEDGREAISYVPVSTPTREPAARLSDVGAPVQLRFLGRTGLRNDKGWSKGAARDTIAADLAQEVVSLLSRGARLHDPSAPTGWRRVHPGDMAVLTRTNFQAQQVWDALAAAGIPAVHSQGRSVFESTAALDLQRWLELLVQPSSDRAARAFAATDLLGFTAEQLAQLDPDRWATYLRQAAWWRQLANRSGVMRGFRRCLDDRGVRARLLARLDGERRLTDLLHLAELLHTVQREQGLGLAGLLAWLYARRDEDSSQDEAFEARLETDARAVRLLTVHKSKGLEFPIVFVPFLWDGKLLRRTQEHALVIPRDDNERGLDVRHNAFRRINRHGLLRGDRDLDDSERAVMDETRRENMRLLYVALTRAKHRVVVWWGKFLDRTYRGDAHTSPLAVLFHGDGGGPSGRFGRAERRAEGGSIDDLWSDLTHLADTSHGTVSVVEVPEPQPQQWRPEEERRQRLSVRSTQGLQTDTTWGLYSYTGLTRGAQAVEAQQPPDQQAHDLDAQDTSPDPAPAPPEAAPDVPLAAFPAGAEAGTCLHEFFELFNFEDAGDDVDPEQRQARVGEALARLLPRHGFSMEEHGSDDVLRGLVGALRTPLGGPAGSLRLCDLPWSARFDELRFDLPLAAAGHWLPGQATVTARDLAAALTCGPNPSWSAAYQALLEGTPFGEFSLAGYLTGAIDLIFQHPGDGRFYVVDYKSNRIDPDRTRRYPVARFAPPLLQQEMEAHHYPVQYLLYTTAVHRYLRHRLGSDYRYEDCMGGVYYLFFRGMVGEPLSQGVAPHGVFHDAPAPEVIRALDTLFSGPPGAP